MSLALLNVLILGLLNKGSPATFHVLVLINRHYIYLYFRSNESVLYYLYGFERTCLNTFCTTFTETRWMRERKLVGSLLSQHFIRTLKCSSAYPTITFFRMAPLIINHSYGIRHLSTLFSHAVKPAIHVSSYVGIVRISSMYILLLE